MCWIAIVKRNIRIRFGLHKLRKLSIDVLLFKGPPVAFLYMHCVYIELFSCVMILTPEMICLGRFRLLNFDFWLKFRSNAVLLRFNYCQENSCHNHFPVLAISCI